MLHPNIRRVSFAKALFALPFLALLAASAAYAEPGAKHGVNPDAPETKPAATAPSTSQPAASEVKAPPAAPQSQTGNQPGAAPVATKSPETKPVRPAPAAAGPAGSQAEVKPPVTAPKPASPAAPAARTAAEPKQPAPGTTGANAADVKTAAPAGESGQAPVAQPKPAQAETGQPAAPGAEVAEPGAATVPKPARKEAAAEPEPVKPAGKQILVNVDKTTQEMTVFVDGIEEHRWPVSTGVYGYTTPSGTYTASSMNEIWYSKQWDNAPMPHSVFFTKKGHAIHGSKEVKSLGKPASHGCVRLSPSNAKTLFQLVKANGLENTQIVIGGETPGGEARIASQPRQRGYGEYDPWAGQGYYPPPPYGWGGRKRRGYAVAPPPGYYRAPPRRRWFQGPGAYPRY